MRRLGTHADTVTLANAHAPFMDILCSNNQSKRATAPQTREILNYIKRTIASFVLPSEYSILIGPILIMLYSTTYISFSTCACVCSNLKMYHMEDTLITL